MHINLDDLLSKATVKQSNLVKRSVIWERANESGETVKDEWDIFIVKEVSFAASDRIYLGDLRSQDSSKNARLISERVRFGEDGTQVMSAEQASNLDDKLGWALAMAVYDLDKENAPKDAKDSSQTKKSGTN